MVDLPQTQQLQESQLLNSASGDLGTTKHNDSLQEASNLTAAATVKLHEDSVIKGSQMKPIHQSSQDHNISQMLQHSKLSTKRSPVSSNDIEHVSSEPTIQKPSQEILFSDQMQSKQERPRALKKGDGKKKQQKQPLQMGNLRIDRIIYPVKTKRGIKHAPQPEQQFEEVPPPHERIGRLLDGFLILFSCRVKLPFEAITSKLASQSIVDVIEDDLCYFQNLTTLDLSDNKVKLEQLKNLKNLYELNLQYNNIQEVPPLHVDDFPCLATLNLAYNNIQASSIQALASIKRLSTLDLTGNNLTLLPLDMAQFVNLEELVLADNNLGFRSSESGCSQLLKSLGRMPHLKRLNLQRNKINRFATEHLNMNHDFPELLEIDVSFNNIEKEHDLWFLTMTKQVNVVVITGNPLANKQNKQSSYDQLEQELQKNLSAVVINDIGLVDQQGFYIKKRLGQKQPTLPYPNPIKLETSLTTEGKTDYLHASDMMRNAAALNITDIRPDTNIDNEIFPRELTKEAQNKDVFTPPNHQQMRFAEDQFPPQSNDAGFFITEDIRDGRPKGAEAIEEEKSDASEATKTPKQQPDDGTFDFGAAKMDFFKQRARQILIEQSTNEDYQYEYGKDSIDEMAYDGRPLPLKLCYQQLKNLLKRPAMTYGHAGQEEMPGYMKLTFAASKSVQANSTVLQLSNMLGSLRHIKGTKDSQMLALKNNADDNLVSALKGSDPKMRVSRRQQEIDDKIERLLIAYKKKDDLAHKKANEIEKEKKVGKKNLMEKFGFSDDEEEDVVVSAAEIKKKAVALP